MSATGEGDRSRPEPVRRRCPDPASLPSPSELKQLTAPGRPVVLELEGWADPAVAAVRVELEARLPDHRVFVSSVGSLRPAITVLPVVSRAEVLSCLAVIEPAIELYRQASVALAEAYRAGTLPNDWEVEEHGEHGRFRCATSGQVVEAPLDAGHCQVDPYFWAVFVASTKGLEPVARLLRHPFHDAARILDIVAEQRER